MQIWLKENLISNSTLALKSTELLHPPKFVMKKGSAQQKLFRLSNVCALFFAKALSFAKVSKLGRCWNDGNVKGHIKLMNWSGTLESYDTIPYLQPCFKRLKNVWSLCISVLKTQCCISVLLNVPNTEKAQSSEWSVLCWIPQYLLEHLSPFNNVFYLTNRFQLIFWFFKRSKHVGGSYVRVSMEVVVVGGWCYLKVKLPNRSTRACGDGGRAQWGGKGVKRYAVKYKETRASPSPRGSPPKGWLHTLVTHHPSNPRSQLSEHRLTHCVTVHIRYVHTYLWKKEKNYCNPREKEARRLSYEKIGFETHVWVRMQTWYYETKVEKNHQQTWKWEEVVRFILSTTHANADLFTPWHLINWEEKGFRQQMRQPIR